MKDVWNRVKIPDVWRQSEMAPIYKQEGDVMECGSYRGIKLMEHAMERVVDKMLREIVDIDGMQFGFMKGRGTT